jgi:tetratricopeptide (TPR) repeat protein
LRAPPRVSFSVSACRRVTFGAALWSLARAAEFPALAEMYRRAGRFEEAEGVVRGGLARAPKTREGHVVLGLILLNQGRYDDALEAFESAAAELLVAAGGDVEQGAADLEESGPTDVELEQAFEQAQPDAELLVTPDSVAEEAVERADVSVAEPLTEHAVSDELGTGGTFVTRTMAEVLERQGDRTGAERIRAALAESGDVSEPARAVDDPGEAWRQHTISVLESWLQNLQGEAR